LTEEELIYPTLHFADFTEILNKIVFNHPLLPVKGYISWTIISCFFKNGRGWELGVKIKTSENKL
jgi:hypothetical protein